MEEDVGESGVAQEQQKLLPKSMNVLGQDDIVHQKSLQQVIREVRPPSLEGGEYNYVQVQSFVALAT